MRLRGEEYSKRLQQFSDDTIRLISDINNGNNREIAIKMSDITTDSELTEEQVVEKLLELKASNTRNSPLSPYRMNEKEERKNE